ncbi:alpha-N-acetylglucosaminidase [Kibdelosporangium aridum]|uniref:Alpha-N-acetylglucosaminidase n=1 Tax=Kibdelosporangium aridum TaxID=2030 RepID=A0A428ZTT2_KIBAR|nr:alpha-N-acetylglucosaminidase TIM-barrel domain-containing protein [Kibdelosporangium aridum]RSM91489.1 alpha-N-acetylglucosaminidase [Kibdelosporangium aridum]
MRRSLVAAIVTAAATVAAPAHATEAWETAPARGVIARLAPQYASQFELRALPSHKDGDSFEISGGDGRIVLSGSSTIALTAAFDHYLRHVAHGQVSWSADQLELGRTLPAPKAPIKLRTPYRHRYIYNFTQFGYTSPYWDWPRWQREIDLLAAKGMNLVLLPVGQEIVWYDTFRQFGYSDEEIRSWIVLPAHQPWQWMSNMSAFGGPISLDLMRRRADLGRRIADRMRSLGITPVLPGFSGLVPGGFADRNPGAKVVPQGDWVGFNRPDWLDPSTPAYQRVADAFYQHQKDRFGTTGAYAVDILHEGGQQGDVDIPAAARGIERAMRTADPSALWVMQAWQTNPRRELVAAVDKSKLLVLDINADNDPRWSKTEAFWNAPWAWGILQNAGGRTGMYGNLAEIAKTLPDVLNSSTRGNLSAVAIAMEGTDQNPVVLDLMADMIWRSTPIDLGEWIADYVHSRYGRRDPDAARAWEVLLRTAYGTRADNIAGVMGAAESLANARPSLTATVASTWGPQQIRHDPDLFSEAWRLMLRAGPRLRRADTYQYDLVDVTRQALADRTRALLPEVRAAYEAKNLPEFRAKSQEFLGIIDAAEQILGTRPEFMLGPWLERAKAWGGNPAERAQLEWDARSILTVWGHRRASDEGGLHDYANRDWSGLTADFYRQRWAKYFDTLTTALAEGRAPEAIDWFAWEDAWSRRTDTFPVKPTGDPYEVSSRLAPQTPVTIATPQRHGASAGQVFDVEVRFANWRRLPVTHVDLALDAPTGWQVRPTGQTHFPAVRPTEAVSATFRVTVPSQVDWGAHRLTARTTYWRGSRTDDVTVNVQPTPGRISDPYLTHATADAQYAESGTGKFAIWASGRDLSGWVDEKGTIYRPGVFGPQNGISARVTSQSGSGPIAKAGLAVANDLTNPDRGGYAVLVMTAQYGPEFMWDSDGNGVLDGWAGGGSSFHPAWLKLSRAGTTYTALASQDGVTWRQIGTADVPSAAGTGDAGVTASAVNLNYPGQTTLAQFDSITHSGLS